MFTKRLSLQPFIVFGDNSNNSVTIALKAKLCSGSRNTRAYVIRDSLGGEEVLQSSYSKFPDLEECYSIYKLGINLFTQLGNQWEE